MIGREAGFDQRRESTPIIPGDDGKFCGVIGRFDHVD